MAECMDEVDKSDTTACEQLNHSFYQDFFGFSSEEWSPNTNWLTTDSTDNIFFGGNSRPTAKVEETNPMFRSSSGSFRHMRFKIASTSRSMSVTVMERNRMSSNSKSKSRWQVFMFGVGSGKFPTKMDLSDIKSRQLRRQGTAPTPKEVFIQGEGGQKKRKKGWWRFIDVLGCGGGYERDTTMLYM